MSFSKPKIEGASLLICDSDNKEADALAKTFAALRSNTLIAKSHQQAWSLVQKDKVDCVVIEAALNNSASPSLSTLIQEYNPHLPIFFISDIHDYKGSVIKENLVEAVFFRPINLEEVVEAVALKLESL